MVAQTANQEIQDLLNGGLRKWHDLEDGEVIAATFYLPQGCDDWNRCFFCGLPDAVNGFNEAYLDGQRMSAAKQAEYFLSNLEALEKDVHTLMVFNAGSFFAEAMNPRSLQRQIIEAVTAHSSLRRLVIEARAPLVTEEALKITDILLGAGKRLTLRIGVETYDDDLRNRGLAKGFSRSQIESAVKVLHAAGAQAGAYVILNPMPNLDQLWAVEETKRTFKWAIDEAGFDEVYFGPTCVPAPVPGQPIRRIYAAWKSGQFRPATLWMTWSALREAAHVYAGRIHLLPFSDQPPFAAVPSNHVPQGIPETLEGALGCDEEFHAMFSRFRDSQDFFALAPPQCECRPSWL